jgi:hypothetical protein
MIPHIRAAADAKAAMSVFYESLIGGRQDFYRRAQRANENVTATAFSMERSCTIQ